MREWHVKHMEKTIIKFVTGFYPLMLIDGRKDSINTMEE
jgi:hypothetical protein